MKTYKKTIEGRVSIVCPGHGTAIINGVEVSNPTEQMLIADGWEDITIPNHERDLTDARREKTQGLVSYANSEQVKGFTINGTRVWFDSATRTSLTLRFKSEQEDGKTDTSIWYGGREFRLTIEDAADIIAQAERYAAECFDTCENHKLALNGLETVEEVDAYDETQDYPESPVIVKTELK